MKTEITKHRFDYLATCPRGLENVLEAELLSLGVSSTRKTKSGIHFEGFNETFIDIAIHSRISSRIYKKLFTFHIEDEKELYQKTKDIKWKALIDSDQTFRFQTHLLSSGRYRSQFSNTVYLSQLMKDALVDRMREDRLERPSVELKMPDVPLMVQIGPTSQSRKEKVEIYLDLTLEPICNRGYRVPGHPAPLRENLAAGFCAMMEIKEKPPTLLMDGLCGTGTILLEAFMMMANIPPSFMKLKAWRAGQKEQFHFQTYQLFEKDPYLLEKFNRSMDQAVEQMERGLKQKPNFSMLGMDIDSKSIEIAKMQFQQLTNSAPLELSCQDFLDFTIPKKEGRKVFFGNLPYGERLGEEEELRGLYTHLGEKIRDDMKDFDVYLLTPRKTLTRNLGLASLERTHLKNGALDCEFLYIERNL